MQLPVEYIQKIKSRSKLHFWGGFLVRAKKHFVYNTICWYARLKGAEIGEGVVLPLSLARKANKNLVVGNDVVIETSDIDLRSKVEIRDHVIINRGVCILRASHFIDESPEYSTKYYDSLVIEPYCWLATSCVVLPSVSLIERGSVIGAFSVLSKNSNYNGVYSGNPAVELRKHVGQFDHLVVCSLKGGDFKYYWNAYHS